jgi:hypothetical protein
MPSPSTCRSPMPFDILRRPSRPGRSLPHRAPLIQDARAAAYAGPPRRRPQARPPIRIPLPRLATRGAKTPAAAHRGMRPGRGASLRGRKDPMQRGDGSATIALPADPPRAKRHTHRASHPGRTRASGSPPRRSIVLSLSPCEPLAEPSRPRPRQSPRPPARGITTETPCNVGRARTWEGPRQESCTTKTRRPAVDHRFLIGRTGGDGAPRAAQQRLCPTLAIGAEATSSVSSCLCGAPVLPGRSTPDPDKRPGPPTLGSRHQDPMQRGPGGGGADRPRPGPIEGPQGRRNENSAMGSQRTCGSRENPCTCQPDTGLPSRPDGRTRKRGRTPCTYCGGAGLAVRRGRHVQKRSRTPCTYCGGVRHTGRQGPHTRETRMNPMRLSAWRPAHGPAEPACTEAIKNPMHLSAEPQRRASQGYAAAAPRNRRASASIRPHPRNPFLHRDRTETRMNPMRLSARTATAPRVSPTTAPAKAPRARISPDQHADLCPFPSPPI